MRRAGSDRSWGVMSGPHARLYASLSSDLIAKVGRTSGVHQMIAEARSQNKSACRRRNRGMADRIKRADRVNRGCRRGERNRRFGTGRLRQHCGKNQTGGRRRPG